MVHKGLYIIRIILTINCTFHIYLKSAVCTVLASNPSVEETGKLVTCILLYQYNFNVFVEASFEPTIHSSATVDYYETKIETGLT